MDRQMRLNNQRRLEMERKKAELAAKAKANQDALEGKYASKEE